MRIDRLDLAAFGNFSGTLLNFDQGKPFQVLLGPNAAGKSTALRAIIDLLFGIPERTSDDFLHPTARLRIGADITTADGRSLSFVRRKGRKDTLLDPSGKPIPEGKLQSLLGAVDRDLFVSMFGLGHERLRRGAEDLLQAGGALGESLFEAAGGELVPQGLIVIASGHRAPPIRSVPDSSCRFRIRNTPHCRLRFHSQTPRRHSPHPAPERARLVGQQVAWLR